jgi:KUP system potassium uptake protein
MFVTFFDTCMVALVAIFVWRLSPYLVILPFLTIALMDGAFLSSALTKVPVGAWFTIMLSSILASFLLLWRFGKEQQWSAEAEDRFPTSHLIKSDADGSLTLSERFSSTPISSTKGLGIFFDKAGETTPIVFSQFVLKLTAIPEVIIFFHLRPLETPSVAPEDRHAVSRLAIPNCYRLVVRYGYNDEIITPDLASVIYHQVRQYLLADGDNEGVTDAIGNTGTAVLATEEAKVSDRESSDVMDEKLVNEYSDSRVTVLDRAYAHKVLYIIGKEQMKITKGGNYFRQVLLWIFLWVRENTRTKMANLRVPTDKIIEVGFLKDI